jgi:hypothetical protein
LNKLITVYWRDIPAQLIGRKGRTTVCKRVLDPRFQHAIDRAAMRARKVSEDAYLEDWRRVSSPCEGDVEQAVADEAIRLESEYTVDVLDTLARAGGQSKSDVGTHGDQSARTKD